MTAEEIAALTRTARDEPDPEERARLLGIDLASATAVRRRYQVTVWTAAVGLSAAILLIRTLRIGFVAGHGRFFPWIVPSLLEVAVAFIVAILSMQIAGGIVGALIPRLARALLGHPRSWYVSSIATASLVTSGMLLLPITIAGDDVTFLFGLAAAMPVAVAVVLRPVDFAKKVRDNDPNVIQFVVADRNDRTGHGLLRGRVRWLTAESVSTMIGALSSVLLLIASPWAILPLAVVDVVTMAGTGQLKRTNRYRTAVVVGVAVSVILLLVALAQMGGLIVPRIDFVPSAPIIPA